MKSKGFRTPTKGFILSSSGNPLSVKNSLQRKPFKAESPLGTKEDTVWQEARLAALERCKHICARCSKSGRLQVHHILPRSAGGGHQQENLTALCLLCHIWVHDNPKESKEDGWLKDRNSSRQTK